jgi:hypothetical protein
MRKVPEGGQKDPLATPTDANFSINGPHTGTGPSPTVIEEEEDTQPTNKAAKLLRYHQKFGHLSMRALQMMAKLGIIPSRLKDCPVPACSTCIYAKAMKRPWRNKSRSNYEEIEKPTRPEQVVSVDQLVSPTPGLVAQMTGRLTVQRYKYAIVFVDQFSRYSYVYLQKTASAEETIKGTIAFEMKCRSMGVTVEAYHADNGIFAANDFVKHCRDNRMNLTFAAKWIRRETHKVIAGKCKGSNDSCY